MREFPPGWATTKFEVLFKRLQYGLTAKANSNAPGVRFLRITDLQNYTIDWGLVPGLVDRAEIGHFLLSHGDFVFARSGSVEKAARVEHPPTAVFASYLIRGTPELPETSDWLAKFIRTVEYLNQVRDRAAGIGMSNVSAAKFASIEIPLAPLEEQRRIVENIDSLTAKSTRARDHLDHLPRLVEKYKQAVLETAFRGDLTRGWRALHRHNAPWKSTTIGDTLVDIRYGTAKKCSYEHGATPVLRIPNVQLGQITVEDLKFGDFDGREVAKLRLDLGDILIIRSNGSLDLVGRSAVVNQAALGMLFAGYLIRLRLDQKIADPTFINLYFMAPETRADIETLAKSTSGVNNINSSQLQALPLLLPEVDEQNEIVRRVERAFQWIDRLASEATNARKLIDHLDQAVLAKAFRGELVPQDPDDEPAGILLERIRAERTTSGRAIGSRGRR